MVKVNPKKEIDNDIEPESDNLQPQNISHKKILVVDDHQLILNGTLDVLKRQYPDGEFFRVKTARDVFEEITKIQAIRQDGERVKAPLNLIVVDLSIPADVGMTATTDTGIELIRQLFKTHIPHFNLKYRKITNKEKAKN
jgi:DNA-binding NarL/FixJ family response regulator